jgi:RsiW-degrading membrane proteinase PrsW (M82 family)/pSer/pThr/pTyr-binding forkhead associated (FHA) protein
MLRLIIQSGSLVGRQFRFEPEEDASLSIGGSVESMVRLTEPSVSSRHALITFKDGGYYLIDQNSTNGTFVNENRIGQAMLRHGDVIGLGTRGPRAQVVIDEQDAPGTRRIGVVETRNLRHETSGLQHETSDLRHGTSDLHHETADLGRRTSDLHQDTTGLRPETSDLCSETNDLRQGTSELHPETADLHQEETSDLRQEVSTAQYFAPQTSRIWMRAAARDIGLYNPHLDTGKSKRLHGATLIWLAFAVLGLTLIGLTAMDVGVSNTLAGAISAIIPAGFYLAIFLWLDRYDPEPPRTLIFAYFWGAIIAVFVSAIYNSVSISTFGDLMTGIVSAPIVEEASKGIGVLIVAIFFRKDFDSVVDGIVYAGVVALGFATMENIHYYGGSLNTNGVGGLIGTWFVRGILSPYSHVLFTCMTGIGVGIARETHNASLRFAAPVMGYFSALFLHSLWNRLAAFDSATFFAGYFFLEVPMFCAFLVVIFRLVNREGRILKQSLAAEVERGLLTQNQLDIAISAFRRTSWVAAAIGNPKLFNARRKFLRAVAKLGLCHWHKQRAAEADRNTDSFPLISQFQAEVFSLRDQIDK